MHLKTSALAFAVGSSSAFVVPRGDSCCFEITASGGESGTVGQLTDGQNRIGGGYSPATYCIKEGGITDSNGRGCILTPPTTQWQCDVGASPTTGFSISGQGGIEYNGNDKFYACAANGTEYNIYTTPVKNQANCVEVTLSSGGKCAGNGNSGGTGTTSSKSTLSSKAMSPPSSSPVESSTKKSWESTISSSFMVSSSSPVKKPSGSQSKPSTPVTTSTEWSATTTTPAKMTTSTVYTTTITTVTSCAADITNCPAESRTTAVVTKTIAISTTVCPVTETEARATPATWTPNSQASKPWSKGSASSSSAMMPGLSSSVPEHWSQPYMPAAQESMPSAQATSKSKPCSLSKSTAPAMDTMTAPAPVVTEASMMVAHPSAPAECQPMTVTVTITESCEAPHGTGAMGSPIGGMSPAASRASAPESSNKVVATTSASPAHETAISSKAPSVPATHATSGSACQTTLSGAYQTPHLIVPISSEHPEQSYGTQYNGQMNSTVSTIFNFDIPESYEGRQCSLIFLLPAKKDLTTSSYDFNDSGSLGCTELNSAANTKTSWENAPSAKKDLGSIELQSGNSYVIATAECQAGTTQSYELSSKGGLSLSFFEDYNPSALGLFITSC